MKDRVHGVVNIQRFLTSEIKDSMLIDDGKNEMSEDVVKCGGQI